MVKKSPAPKSKDRVKLVKPENTDSGAALKKVKKTRVKTPAMIANPGGQPCKLDECGAKIIEYIRAGNTYENACGCARISYFTFNSWMKRGKEELEKGEIDSKYVKFLQDVRQAETDCEDEIVRHWLKAIPNNWQAGKEYLARKNPDKWGSKEKMDVTSNGESIGKPIFLPLKGDE